MITPLRPGRPRRPRDVSAVGKGDGQTAMAGGAPFRLHAAAVFGPDHFSNVRLTHTARVLPVLLEVHSRYLHRRAVELSVDHAAMPQRRLRRKPRVDRGHSWTPFK